VHERKSIAVQDIWQIWEEKAKRKQLIMAQETVKPVPTAVIESPTFMQRLMSSITPADLEAST